MLLACKTHRGSLSTREDACSERAQQGYPMHRSELCSWDTSCHSREHNQHSLCSTTHPACMPQRGHTQASHTCCTRHMHVHARCMHASHIHACHVSRARLRYCACILHISLSHKHTHTYTHTAYLGGFPAVPAPHHHHRALAPDTAMGLSLWHVCKGTKLPFGDGEVELSMYPDLLGLSTKFPVGGKTVPGSPRPPRNRA